MPMTGGSRPLGPACPYKMEGKGKSDREIRAGLKEGRKTKNKQCQQSMEESLFYNDIGMQDNTLSHLNATYEFSWGYFKISLCFNY